MTSTTTLKAIASGTPPTTANERPKDLAHLMAMPSVQAQIRAALPRHMTAERMARIAMTELRKTPKLMKCEPMSFLGAVIQCAQLGLEPGNALGHAYILPYEKRQKVGGQWQTVATEAQLIIGYRGMIDLARRSGQILSLSATAVYQGDEFECVMGLDPTLRHVPDFNNPDREMADRLTFVYAVAKLKDGGTQFAVMSRSQIDAIRARSKAAESGPWVTDYEAMALKTVIRRLFKYLPVSIEMQRATQLDEKADAGLSQDHGYVIEGESQLVDTTVADDGADQGDGAPKAIYADVLAAMLKAKTRDAIDEAATLITAVSDEKQRAELQAKYEALRADILG